MKLPLKFREPHCDTNYDVEDSNEEIIFSYERWDYSISPDYEEAKEIVKVTQLFPEAVKLLKECCKLFEDVYTYNSDVPINVKEFLTKVEEDENA